MYLFYLMGKSASGKDTIYEELLKIHTELRPLVAYTTRPIRTKERDGDQYHFTDEAHLRQLQAEGRVIELREYQTVMGSWYYFTADDEHMDLTRHDYLGIGTLESYLQIRAYFGETAVRPLYVEVEDGLRLERALKRERKQEKPRYEEMCRRFLADQQDFSRAHLEQAGIRRRFCNDGDRTDCIREISGYMTELTQGERT